MSELLKTLSLEHVLHTVPSGLFLVDMDRHIVYWNPEAERLTGFSAEEILGKHCSFLEGIECGRVCGLFNEDIPKPVIGGCCTIKTKDGAPLVLYKNVDYLRDRDDRIIGGIESFIDISTQVHLEQQLRQHTARLEEAVRQRTAELEKERSRLITALDSMTDFAYIASADHRVEFMNRSMLEAFGPQLGKPCYEGLQDRQTPCPDCPMPKVLSGQTVKEERCCPVGGRTFEIIHTPLKTAAGLIQKMAVFRDITERKEAEQRLRDANRELDAFVYTVSHDLRTPLTPILGYAEFLRAEYKEQLDGRAMEILEDIEGQGRKMLALMEDLLTLARVGHVEPAEKPVNLGAIVVQVLEDYKERVMETGMKVQLSPLPKLRVPPTFLSALFSNLISNALSYAAKPGGLLEIGATTKERHPKIFVRDHGPGLSAEEKELVFDLFYRAKATRRLPGTGIGLTTARKIMRLYGGRIWVEDTPGGGCTFWIEFPKSN